MSSKIIKVVLVILGSLLLTGIFIFLFNHQLNFISRYSDGGNDFELLRCNQSSDCVSVRGDYCGCNSMGIATAINKNFTKDWKSRFQPTMCFLAMSNDWTCIKSTPRCLLGTCYLTRDFF